MAFTSAPPEAVCLCVGTNRVAVSDARECCFVLEKGARHPISLSYVPTGVDIGAAPTSFSSGCVRQCNARFGIICNYNPNAARNAAVPRTTEA